MAVIEGAFFLCLAPEDLVVAVRIKRRVDINQVNAFVGEFFQLFEVVAAVNDAGIDERGPSFASSFAKATEDRQATEGRWFGGRLGFL